MSAARAQIQGGAVKLFAVFKEGIYRHECAGIFSHEDAARAVAEKIAAAGDGYHDFHVVPFTLNVTLPLIHSDSIDEPASTYVINKKQLAAP